MSDFVLVWLPCRVMPICGICPFCQSPQTRVNRTLRYRRLLVSNTVVSDSTIPNVRFVTKVFRYVRNVFRFALEDAHKSDMSVLSCSNVLTFESELYSYRAGMFNFQLSHYPQGNARNVRFVPMSVLPHFDPQGNLASITNRA